MATKKTIDIDTVRELAMALPGIEEGSIHGAPSFKVRGKLLACPAIHRSAEPDSLAVRIDLDRRAEWIAADPNVCYVTDHYVKHPMVLVRLSRVRPDALRELLEEAWRSGSTKSKKGGSDRRSS